MDNPGLKHHGPRDETPVNFIKVTYRRSAAPAPTTVNGSGYSAPAEPATQRQNVETPPPMAGGSVTPPPSATNGAEPIAQIDMSMAAQQAAEQRRIQQQQRPGGGAVENPAYNRAQQNVREKMQARRAHPLHQAHHNPTEDIHDVVAIQGADGNWDSDPYMHGMFNGMELVRSIHDGDEPEFREAPDEWLSKDASTFHLANFIQLYRTGALSDEELERIRQQNEEARRWLDEEAERAGAGWEHERRFYQNNPGARSFEQQTHYTNPMIREHPEAQTRNGEQPPEFAPPDVNHGYTHVFSIPEMYNNDRSIELHLGHDGYDDTDGLGLRPHYNYRWMYDGAPIHEGEAWGPVRGEPDMHDMARTVSNFASYDADRLDNDPEAEDEENRDLRQHVGTPYHDFLSTEGERLGVAGIDPEHGEQTHEFGPQLVRESRHDLLLSQKQSHPLHQAAQVPNDDPVYPYSGRVDPEDSVDVDNLQSGDDTFRPHHPLADRVINQLEGLGDISRGHGPFLDRVNEIINEGGDEDTEEGERGRNALAEGLNTIFDSMRESEGQSKEERLQQAKDAIDAHFETSQLSHKEYVKRLQDDWKARGGRKTGEPVPVERFTPRFTHPGGQVIVPDPANPFPELTSPIYPVGKCEGCGTTLFDSADASGDPRGALGDHTVGTLDAAEYSPPGERGEEDRRMHGPSAFICPNCDADAERQERILDRYRGHKAGELSQGGYWGVPFGAPAGSKREFIPHRYPKDRVGKWHAPGEKPGQCYECDHGITGWHRRNPNQPGSGNMRSESMYVPRSVFGDQPGD